MKNVIKILTVGLFAAQSALAATQWESSFAYLWNGASDVYYDLNGATANADFTGNLGSFTTGAPNTFFLNAQINGQDDDGSGDTYTFFRLHWRVDGGSWGTQTATPSYLGPSLLGGESWQGLATGADLSGLAAGTHTIELYLSRSHTWSGGGYTTYLTASGDVGGAVDPNSVPPSSNFFSAEVNVVPEPSTLALSALGLFSLIAARRRMAK